MTVTIKVRADFPVRDGESFVVHDSDGMPVERWHHVHSDPIKEGATHAWHIYVIEVLRNYP